MPSFTSLASRTPPARKSRGPNVFVPSEGYRMDESGLAAARESMATWPIVVFLLATFGLPWSGVRQFIR